MIRPPSLVLATALLATPVTSAQENLYAVSQGFWYRLDATTGIELESALMPSVWKPWSLAYDGSRLISVDVTGAGVDELLSIHPANGAENAIGPTGESWGFHGMDVHPVSGTIYAFLDDEVFVIDAQTGQASSAGSLSGLLSFDCICSFAFLPDGTGWGIGLGNGALYSVDVTTGSANLEGILSEVAADFSEFYDLAVDSSGQLWGMYPGATKGGVYKIDTANLTIQMVAFNSVYKGIAFGPATPETFYCTPKTNSLGCVPSLDAEGLASPTATSGYQVTATNVRNRTWGRLIYSVNGPASTPFGGGTLCLASPWRGTSIVSSGGSPKPTVDCSGVWTYDLNAELQSQPGPQAGDTLHCQWIGRDPGFAPPDTYALTSALQLTLLP